jgi:hypothetical protein
MTPTAAQPTANLKISTRSSEWPVWSKAQVEWPQCDQRPERQLMAANCP